MKVPPHPRVTMGKYTFRRGNAVLLGQAIHLFLTTKRVDQTQGLVRKDEEVTKGKPPAVHEARGDVSSGNQDCLASNLALRRPLSRPRESPAGGMFNIPKEFAAAVARMVGGSKALRIDAIDLHAQAVPNFS